MSPEKLVNISDIQLCITFKIYQGRVLMVISNNRKSLLLKLNMLGLKIYGYNDFGVVCIKDEYNYTIYLLDDNGLVKKVINKDYYRVLISQYFIIGIGHINKAISADITSLFVKGLYYDLATQILSKEYFNIQDITYDNYSEIPIEDYDFEQYRINGGKILWADYSNHFAFINYKGKIEIVEKPFEDIDYEDYACDIDNNSDNHCIIFSNAKQQIITVIKLDDELDRVEIIKNSNC